jgi:WD40 repeat protein
LFFSLLVCPPVARAGSPPSPIWSIQFSPDGKYLAVGQYQWVQLWDVQTHTVVRNFEPHADAVRCLKFSHDSKILFAGGGTPAEGGEVKLWDVESGDLIKTLELHDDTIEAIATNANDSLLLTASMDERVFVSALPEGKTEHTPTQLMNRALAVDYRSDGKYFVTGSADKTVKIWNAQTYEVLVNFDQNDGPVYSVAFAPEENMLVSGSADNAVRSWRVVESAGGSGKIETSGALVRVYNGHRGTVYAVDCGRRGSEAGVIIVSGGADRSIIVWDLRSGNRLYTFNQPTDEVYALDLSANGQFVAAGGRDGVARIWDLASGRLIAELLE